jgi:hypothetical protein
VSTSRNRVFRFPFPAIETYSTSEHSRVQLSHCLLLLKSRAHASAPAHTILPLRVLKPSLISSVSLLDRFAGDRSSMCLHAVQMASPRCPAPAEIRRWFACRMPCRDSGAASDSSWTGCGDWCDTTTQDAASQHAILVRHPGLGCQLLCPVLARPGSVRQHRRIPVTEALRTRW